VLENTSTAIPSSAVTRSSSPALIVPSSVSAPSTVVSTHHIFIHSNTHIRSSSSNVGSSNNSSGLSNSRASLIPELAQHRLLSAIIEANSIYSYYIEIGAPNELNLGAPIRLQTRGVLDAIVMAAATANNMDLPQHASSASSSSSTPLPQALPVVSITNTSNDSGHETLTETDRRSTVKVLTRKGVSVSTQLTVEEAVDLELKVRSMFDGCLDSVVTLLDTNCFQRFRLSDSYQTLLNNLRGVTSHRNALMMSQGIGLDHGKPSSGIKHHQVQGTSVPLAMIGTTGSGRQLLTVPGLHPSPLPSPPILHSSSSAAPIHVPTITTASAAPVAAMTMIPSPIPPPLSTIDVPQLSPLHNTTNRSSMSSGNVSPLLFGPGALTHAYTSSATCTIPNLNTNNSHSADTNNQTSMRGGLNSNGELLLCNASPRAASQAHGGVLSTSTKGLIGGTTGIRRGSYELNSLISPPSDSHSWTADLNFGGDHLIGTPDHPDDLIDHAHTNNTTANNNNNNNDSARNGGPPLLLLPGAPVPLSPLPPISESSLPLAAYTSIRPAHARAASMNVMSITGVAPINAIDTLAVTGSGHQNGNKDNSSKYLVISNDPIIDNSSSLVGDSL
jgi:hypothetical protein